LAYSDLFVVYFIFLVASEVPVSEPTGPVEIDYKGCSKEIHYLNCEVTDLLLNSSCNEIWLMRKYLTLNDLFLDVLYSLYRQLHT
jgi:hypothetical protein